MSGWRRDFYSFDTQGSSYIHLFVIPNTFHHVGTSQLPISLYSSLFQHMLVILECTSKLRWAPFSYLKSRSLLYLPLFNDFKRTLRQHFWLTTIGTHYEIRHRYVDFYGFLLPKLISARLALHFPWESLPHLPPPCAQRTDTITEVSQSACWV